MDKKSPPNRSTTKAAPWLLAVAVFVGGFEGLRTVAYRDPVGIPTICYGSTAGVKLGQRATAQQCQQLLGEELYRHYVGMADCVKVPMTDDQVAAFTSFTFNVGVSAFCKSTLVRKLNSGDTAGACAELSRWNKAKGIPLPGLARRRAAERDLCEGKSTLGVKP